MSDMQAELAALGSVQIQGADAESFLQAHFCNDVTALAEGETQLSGYCSPKGRLLAIFHLARRGGEFWLVAHREVIPPMLERLSMFAKMAKPVGKQMFAQVTHTDVQLSDRSEELAVIGLTSEVARNTEQALQGINVPRLRLSGKQPDAATRCYLLVDADTRLRVTAALVDLTTKVTEARWQLEDIRAGLPVVVASTRDEFVPQMANLQLLGGLSFNKGCYPGQEIVARLQYLGSLKRRMERAAGKGHVVAAGAAVVAADGKVVGKVVQSADAETGIELLMVVRIAALDAPLFLADTTDTKNPQPGRALTLLPLPYAFADVTESAS